MKKLVSCVINRCINQRYQFKRQFDASCRVQHGHLIFRYSFLWQRTKKVLSKKKKDLLAQEIFLLLVKSDLWMIFKKTIPLSFPPKKLGTSFGNLWFQRFKDNFLYVCLKLFCFFKDPAIFSLCSSFKLGSETSIIGSITYKVTWCQLRFLTFQRIAIFAIVSKKTKLTKSQSLKLQVRAI